MLQNVTCGSTDLRQGEWRCGNPGILSALGRELGILDLNGGTGEGEEQLGAWTWYAFGTQRFARLLPHTSQQPLLHTSDLASEQQVDQMADQYTALMALLLELGDAPGGIPFGIRVVLVEHTDGTWSAHTEAEYTDLASGDMIFGALPTTWIKLSSSETQVGLKRAGSNDPIQISIEELLGEGTTRSEISGVRWSG